MHIEPYQIAQSIIPKIKEKCPKIVIPSGKNQFTFFAGSENERVVPFRRMIANVDPYWAFLDWEPMLRSWGTRVNAGSLASDYMQILLREVFPVMGLESSANPRLQWNQLNYDHSQIAGKAIQIAKAKIWGIPVNLRAEQWFFQRLFSGLAKKTVPDSVWKLACTNTGNFFNVNENVLRDALSEEKAYQTLYAIHPWLGRSWVPSIREIVERTIQDEADYTRYAQQLNATMKVYGIQKSGIRTLHRIAEKNPALLRTLYRKTLYPQEENDHEIAALLNYLNGKKTVHGVSMKNIIDQSLNPHHEFARQPEDMIVIERIRHWSENEPQIDYGLLYDWMTYLSRDKKGSLYRGYLDVTKNLKSAFHIKRAVLEWVDRSQRHWHLHQPVIPVDLDRPKQAYTWKPLIAADHPQNPHCALDILREKMFLTIEAWMEDFQFIELTSSTDLDEEGEQMKHCVAGYDYACSTGQSHIFSVRHKNGDRISTLEVQLSRVGKGRKKKYAIIQNRGYRNKNIGKTEHKAAKQFVEWINEYLKEDLAKRFYR